MQWIEIALRVENSLIDTIVDILSPYSYQGVAIEQDDIPVDMWDEGEVPTPTHQTVRAYIPDDDRVETIQREINNALKSVVIELPIYRQVNEQDWAEAWKVHYHPIRLGKHIVVRPLWEDAEILQGDIEIALDPGMAFGTGTHATTQLCLEAIEDLLVPNMSVLDLGSGSGILSIAAAKLGASHVYAVDNDPVATSAAILNIEQNHVSEKVNLSTGSLADILALNYTFDFVVVNILARIIVELCDAGMGDAVKPGGTAIFSGIIESQIDEVTEALKSTGLTPQGYRQQGDWVLIETSRKI